MGALLSREKTDSKDFEKILSELDVNIRKAEGRLSEIKIRQRRTSFMGVFYSLVIWVCCVIYLFYQLNTDQVATEKIFYTSIPIVLLPVGIYYIRKSLAWYYEVKQKKEEVNLTTLRKEQKSKVEELKKKTSYYTTQSLLERYDEVLAKKKQDEAKRQQEQELRQRKPVSMPMRQQQASPFPPSIPPTAAGPHQPILPQPQQKSEPQWYDKIVDALVGDVGPETKYALICNHCFHHNGLVIKEEFDTIQYVCPNCKQFNPSRKSKQVAIQQQVDQHNNNHHDQKEKELSVVNESHEDEEEDADKVLEKLKAQVEADKDITIAQRVRQRHIDEEE